MCEINACFIVLLNASRGIKKKCSLGLVVRKQTLNHSQKEY